MNITTPQTRPPPRLSFPCCPATETPPRRRWVGVVAQHGKRQAGEGAGRASLGTSLTPPARASQSDAWQDGWGTGPISLNPFTPYPAPILSTGSPGGPVLSMGAGRG